MTQLANTASPGRPPIRAAVQDDARTDQRPHRPPIRAAVQDDARTDQRPHRQPPAVLRRRSAEGATETAAIKEIGARAIYDFRSHPRKASWENAAAETRAAYAARMQELMNALAAEGFAIVRR